jgi:hypothetical protein
MKKRGAPLQITFILALSVPFVSMAANQESKKNGTQATEAQDKKAPPPGDAPVYKPPLRGAPSSRIGGGTRGLPDAGGRRDVPDRTVVLAVLTPDHSGLTIQEQPTLYWYVSHPITYPIEITVIESKAVKPSLETQISAPSKPGLQKVRLSDHGLHLKPGVEYQWFVAVLPNRDVRSKDLLAGGLIQRVEPSMTLRARLAQATPAQAPHIYADEGIWYDALSALSDIIDAAPDDAKKRQQRAALLEQIGLQEVAQHDLGGRSRK